MEEKLDNKITSLENKFDKKFVLLFDLIMLSKAEDKDFQIKAIELKQNSNKES